MSGEIGLKFFSFNKYKRTKKMMTINKMEDRSLPYHTLRKIQEKLNNSKFSSEARMDRILKEMGIVGGYRKNYPLCNRFFGDFVFPKKSIVLEVDGIDHLSRKESDRIREDIITMIGWKVLRFDVRDSDKSWKSKLMSIEANLKDVYKKR